VGENYFSRLHDLNKPWGDRFRRIRQVLYQGRFKLIRSSDGAHELYDLDRDPGESTNLFETRPEVAEALTRRLQMLVQEGLTAGAAADAEELTEEQLEMMRALGYLDDAESGGER
jgi:hypothetical protein